jgi:hypothetical protein
MITPSLQLMEGVKNPFFTVLKHRVLGGNIGHGYYKTNPQE